MQRSKLKPWIQLKPNFHQTPSQNPKVLKIPACWPRIVKQKGYSDTSTVFQNINHCCRRTSKHGSHFLASTSYGRLHLSCLSTRLLDCCHRFGIVLLDVIQLCHRFGIVLLDVIQFCHRFGTVLLDIIQSIMP